LERAHDVLLESPRFLKLMSKAHISVCILRPKFPETSFPSLERPRTDFLILKYRYLWNNPITPAVTPAVIPAVSPALKRSLPLETPAVPPALERPLLLKPLLNACCNSCFGEASTFGESLQLLL
jgi:hypothetical protein